MNNQMNPMNNQQRQMTQMNRQMNPMNNQMNSMNNQMNGGINPMNAMGSINNPLNKANGKINQVLPAEMLERIFLLLEPKDLKNSVLVCKRWAQVGEASTLWTWVSLTLGRKTLAAMSSTRLRQLRKVQVWFYF